MKRVLYDTNVLLDVLLQRLPHYPASAAALTAGDQAGVEAFVAGHAVTTIDYVLRREIGPSYDRAVLVAMLAKLRVGAVTDAVIRRALASPARDFEDSVTRVIAEDEQVDAIVTRDATGFASANIPVLLPDAYRALLAAQPTGP